MRRSLALISLAVPALLFSCQKSRMSYPGYVEGDFLYVTSVSSGRIMAEKVGKGSTVQMGDLLFEVDASNERAQVAAGKAQLSAALAALANLKAPRRTEEVEVLIQRRADVDHQLVLNRFKLKREKELLEKGYSSEQNVLELSTNEKSLQARIKDLNSQIRLAEKGARPQEIEQASAQVRMVAANLTLAEKNLSDKNVTAPKAGLVFDIYTRPGEFTQAGQAVLALLPAEAIQIYFYLPEPDLEKIKVGGHITFHLDGLEETFAATVAVISTQAEYTPPIIFSEDVRQKLVFQIEAVPETKALKHLHIGQPISVHLL